MATNIAGAALHRDRGDGACPPRYGLARLFGLTPATQAA
jgi:hypothetical protein